MKEKTMTDTEQDTMFQFNIMVDSLEYAVEKFDGKTRLTKQDIANMRAMVDLAKKQGIDK